MTLSEIHCHSVSIANKKIELFKLPSVPPQGGIRQIASVLNWYGALFVELARVAACAVPALQGNVIPLAANTASVIKPDGEALCLNVLCLGH